MEQVHKAATVIDGSGDILIVGIIFLVVLGGLALFLPAGRYWNDERIDRQ